MPGWSKVPTIRYNTSLSAAFVFTGAILIMPPAAIIHGIKIKHSTAFTGGAVATCVLSIGVVGALDKYATAFNVLQVPGDTIYEVSSGLWSENNAVPINMVYTITTTGAFLNALNQGICDIWVLMSIAA